MSTLTIDVTDEVMERVEWIARTRGVSVEALVSEALEKSYGRLGVDVEGRDATVSHRSQSNGTTPASYPIDSQSEQPERLTSFGDDPLPMPDYARAAPGKREIPWAGMYRSDGTVNGENYEEYLEGLADRADRRS